MLIFPAIDLFGGKAVRLYKGEYDKMTVYSELPSSVAVGFREMGAGQIHIVDLEGARSGGTPNLRAILDIKRVSRLFCEVGGGVRDMETVEKYLDGGIDRVIIGTAAVTDEKFAAEAAARYPGRVAAGADLRDGLVAIRGWTESSEYTAEEFFERMLNIGISDFICTDISRDGAMRGTNLDLYRALARRKEMRVTASGGVSTLEDVRALAAMGLYGAIIGRAYYEGTIRLRDAIEAAE